MPPPSHQVAEYLDRFRQGEVERAFHGLLEMPPDILPGLIEAFRAEHESQIRAFLVEVIWQHRQPSVIPFLGEALRDADPRVWRKALDGLVTLASPAALDVLHAAQLNGSAEFLHWIEEAIEQTEAEVSKATRDATTAG